MNLKSFLFYSMTSVVVASLVAFSPEATQPQAGRGAARGGQRGAAIISPEVSADRHITFRLSASLAQGVRLAASDIPGLGQSGVLSKGEDGLWSTTIGPIDPGAYRYNFNVDGVSTIDPRNPAVSESNTNVWSLVVVPGADFMDVKNIQHGAVAAVHYYSMALGTWRRMHIYTPPGYETDNQKYPVFYLLHGAGDSDASWTSVGRANFILDNLIAAKKARPMIVVMPAGHTSRTAGSGGGGGLLSSADDFARDFLGDVMPYVEKHYRVFTDRPRTAIAGLSMGGSQTLNISIPRLDRFAYIGVYSSGLIGEFPDAAGAGGRAGRGEGDTTTAPATTTVSRGEGPNWETRNQAKLDNASLKKGLKLLWFSTGRDDRLVTTTRATVTLLKNHGFTPVFEESTGGHTWINWRNHLNVFVPQLFQ